MAAKDSRKVLTSASKLLRHAHVHEPTGRIISEAGIPDSVSAFPESLGRILIEDVVASDRDA